jgi:membrane protease YdiL (CAAX protease family)
MIVESAVLAVPLFVVSALVRHYVPIMTAGASGGEAALASSSDILLAATAPDWRGMVVLSLGAGIYEELVFRLIAFAALSLVFVDLLKGDRRRAGPLIVVVAAVLFALYHYKGPEAFTWPTFVFRTVAGLYFGVVFLVRGFGVTVGSHAAYDIIIVGLAYGRSAH